MDIRSVHQDLNLDHKQLAAVFDLAPVCMAVLSRDSGGAFFIEAGNRAFWKLLSLPLDQGRQALQAVMEPAAIKLLHNRLDDLLKGAQLEMSFLGGADKVLLCEVSLAPLSEASDQFVMVLEDIAVRKALEELRLEAAGIEQREDFIATLTHDLKTPIVGANMVLMALLEGTLGGLTAEQSQIIQKLKTSNQALLKMIQNLLEVYKYESGHSSLALDDVDLQALIKFATEDVRPLIENKSQKLNVTLPPAPLTIVCDQYAVQRVLVNLLGNAIKFTPTGGTITVSLEDDGAYVVLKVTDTGSGINQLDQQRLFQRFWQGEPGKRYAAGTGLGLYFCAHVARAHGGAIACQSSPGVGSTFIIRLPKRGPSDSYSVPF